MKPHVRPGTFADAIAVAKNLRPEDIREIEGLGHNVSALPFYLLSSEPGVSFFNDANEIAGIAGVLPTDEEHVGMVWMLCTPALEKNPIKFVKMARTWLDGLSDRYRLLWNLADARNHFHHKLVKMLGFRAIATQYPPPYNLPYLEIVRLCASPQPEPEQQPLHLPPQQCKQQA